MHPTGLELRGVSVTRGARVVFAGVDADLAGGSVTAITGPSGSGKSTLLRACNGLIAPTSGSIRLDGTDITEMAAPQLRRLVGLVAQKPVMFAGTVAENINYGQPTADVTLALELAGLAQAFAARDARRLSGGEQARVAIARALALEPRVLLLDEATAPLDHPTARRLATTLRELAECGLAAVLATHDTALTAEFCDREVALGGT